MSNATRWGFVYLLVAACATGGSTGNGNGDDKVDAAVAVHHDASTQVTTDASTTHTDAAVPHDAYVPPADAASGLFCSQNSECTNSGECCLTLGGPTGFCAPGTIVLGACIPQ